MALMTQSQYARHRGVSRSVIHEFKAKGLLAGAFRKRGNKVYIVSTIADKLLSERLDPAHVKTGPSSDPGYLDARTWETRYKAASRKLDYEVKTGKFILKKDVEDRAFTSGRIFRDSLYNVGPRIAPIVAAEKDPAAIQKILKAEFDTILSDFVRSLAKI